MERLVRRRMGAAVHPRRVGLVPIPGATANELERVPRARLCTPTGPARIPAQAIRTTLRIVATVPIRDPFPRVPDHVMEPVPARRSRSDVPRPPDLRLAAG